MTPVLARNAIAEGPNSHAELIELGGRRFWTTGQRVIQFIETMCIFSNARWTGDPFVLQNWQKKLIYELFEIDPLSGLRRFRRALIGIPRKNGKTELAAALALYFASADNERSAEVYCAAASEEQADRVFMAARRMCELDDAPLSGEFIVPEGKFADTLVNARDHYSYIKRLTSKGRTKHGLNIHCAVLDEVHAWTVGEAEELWAALTTGMASREQPMMLMITTAGADIEVSRCGGLYSAGRAMERGEQDDDGFFFRWWEAPEDMDYRDPKAWQAAMPNLGVSVTVPFLKGELAGTNLGANGKGQKALTRAEFERLYLNRWLDFGEAPWVTRDQLDPCRVRAFRHEYQAQTWVGVDLSRSVDSTAVAWGQWIADDERPCGHTGEPCLYVKAKEWERPRKQDGAYDEEWKAPLPEIRQFIRDLNAEFTVGTNVFDPYGSQLMVLDLEADGITCESITQQGQRRSSAATGMYDLIVQGRFHYDQDVVERHIMNATVKETGEDGYYLQKRRKGKVMDVAQAASHVVYGTIWAKGVSGPSVYEERGLLDI